MEMVCDTETHDNRRGCDTSDIRPAVVELRLCEVPTRKDEKAGRGEGIRLRTHKLDGDGGGVEQVGPWGGW